jgi:hypothetical protein
MENGPTYPKKNKIKILHFVSFQFLILWLKQLKRNYHLVKYHNFYIDGTRPLTGQTFKERKLIFLS